MSGEQIDQIAPRLAVAKKATIACGVLGSQAATRSPRRTPASRIACASEPTWRRSSGQRVSTGSAMRSRWNTIAGWPAACAASAWRSTWRAKLVWAPGNQTAPGMRSSARTAVAGVGDSTPKKSRIEAQKASSSVTDHDHSAS